MSPDVMIQLEGLSIRYGSFQAVKHLDLSLYRGELFGLLGPNGAGKSSTVRVLIGQRKPSAGKATVAGFDVVREWSKIKPLFGYVPDRDNHFDEFTGRRNLLFFAGLYGVPEYRVEEALAQVELTDSANNLVRSYSMGMRKKLLLARALLHKPPVLYLDEPTANLDVHSASIVHRILREHVRLGGTVLLTTHNMQEVEAICDRVGILCSGKLVALDTPLALRQRHTERVVDTTLAGGERRVFNLDSDADRAILADKLRDGRVGTLHTREFDFHSTFLKLTGTAFE